VRRTSKVRQERTNSVRLSTFTEDESSYIPSYYEAFDPTSSSAEIASPGVDSKTDQTILNTFLYFCELITARPYPVSGSPRQDDLISAVENVLGEIASKSELRDNVLQLRGDQADKALDGIQSVCLANHTPPDSH
jgi:hypothetical protein